MKTTKMRTPDQINTLRVSAEKRGIKMEVEAAINGDEQGFADSI
jgi:hypothetical protein